MKKTKTSNEAFPGQQHVFDLLLNPVWQEFTKTLWHIMARHRVLTLIVTPHTKWKLQTVLMWQ